MGALDDAIRDHLELKRKHGASEEEIRQGEREALGPGGPGFEAQRLQAEPEAQDTGSAPSDAQAASPVLDDELLGEIGAADGTGPPAHTPAEEVATEKAAPALEPGMSPVDADPDEVLPAETLEPNLATDGSETADPVEDRERVAPQEADPNEHDPLDDVPGFLEESPEQDRLWFEQRPPKDFDFDD
jgi:hypothetical protein